MSHRSWHTSLGSSLRVAVAAGALCLAPRAFACGATPVEAYPLLPVPNQHGVPLNAVLTVGLSYDNVEFSVELVESGSGDSVQVLEPFCDKTVCTVRPASDLEPNTAYRYRVAPSASSVADSGDGWIEFSTGEKHDLGQPEAEVTLSLTAAEPREPADEQQHPCGYFRTATFEVTTRGLVEPVTVVAPGVLPTFFSGPVVLTESGTTTLEIVGAPVCFTPSIYDDAGHRSMLEEICLPESGFGKNEAPEPPTAGVSGDPSVAGAGGAVSVPPVAGSASSLAVAGGSQDPPSPSGDARTDAAAEGSPESRACGMSPHKTPGSALLLFAIGTCAVLWRRRREHRLST